MDTVTVKTQMTFAAFLAPKTVRVILDEEEPGENWLCVEDIEPHVLDALAQQWLDHLYASVGRGCPFFLTTTPQEIER